MLLLLLQLFNNNNNGVHFIRVALSKRQTHTKTFNTTLYYECNNETTKSQENFFKEKNKNAGDVLLI